MNVLIIGLGLIGGSFAIDIKKYFKGVTIYGWDNDQKNLDSAKELGIIDKITSFGCYKNNDLIILAIPVDEIKIQLPSILNQIQDNTWVFDVGSTKHLIAKSVVSNSRRGQYVSVHPIAGTEFSGIHSALSGLFENAVNIICDKELTHPLVLKKAIDFFNAFSMEMHFMNSKSHDEHIAFVSHLSHISSFMLSKTVLDKERKASDIFTMAGSGFESTVRLAKSNPKTWTSIFKENKENVINALNLYIENLHSFKDLLENGEYQFVKKNLEISNQIKQVLKK